MLVKRKKPLTTLVDILKSNGIKCKASKDVKSHIFLEEKEIPLNGVNFEDIFYNR